MKKDYDATMSKEDAALMKRITEGTARLCPMDNTMTAKLRFAWALLCYPKATSGDIEVIMKNGETVKCASVDSLPPSFEEFLKETKGAKAFHARIGIPTGKNNEAEYLPAVISNGYSFMYDLLIGDTGCVLYHATMLPKEMREDLKHYLLSKSPDADELTPPVKTNPEKLVNTGKLIVEKHSLHSSFSDMEENIEYYCHRPSFNFYCLRSIPCCGMCPMLKESYDILINDVLDPESANELKELVEKAGFFTGERCSECNGKGCPMDKFNVVNYINFLWHKAFR